MGKFIYGATAVSVDLEDRGLAHLRVVVMTKLRRNESFMFDVEVGDGNGRRTFWIHPSIPLQFHFFGGRPPRLNRDWIEEMICIASSATGLTIPPEPKESKHSRDDADADAKRMDDGSDSSAVTEP